MTASPRHASGAMPRPHGQRRVHRRRNPVAAFLGVVGEILITVGVIGLLFVVWELWWTGIDAERDRNEATESFYQQMDDLTPQAAAPDNDDDDDSAQPDDPTPMDVDTCYQLPDGTEIGCSPSMRNMTDGETPMAMLYAPRLGSSWNAPVRYGTAATQLDRGGVGHYTSTQWPDEPGNFAVAGHRNTNASMLGHQDQLQVGDPLYLQTYEGIYTYQVTDSHVVTPQQTEVLTPVPSQPGVEAETGVLTLTTCHPMYSNRERLITHAELVDFQPTGAPVPESIAHHMPEGTPVAGGA